MGSFKAAIGVIIIALLVLISCISKAGEGAKVIPPVLEQHTIIDSAGNTIFNRFNPLLDIFERLLTPLPLVFTSDT